MDPKDLVYLKNKDIQDVYLVFVRAKTESATRNDPKPIIVYISEDMWEILQRYRNKDTSSEYVTIICQLSSANYQLTYK